MPYIELTKSEIEALLPFAKNSKHKHLIKTLTKALREEGKAGLNKILQCEEVAFLKDKISNRVYVIEHDEEKEKAEWYIFPEAEHDIMFDEYGGIELHLNIISDYDSGEDITILSGKDALAVIRQNLANFSYNEKTLKNTYECLSALGIS